MPLTKEWPPELTALSQELPKAIVSSDVACVLLHVVEQALYEVSYVRGVIQVHSRLVHEIIVIEVNEAEALVVFELEKAEDERLDAVILREYQLAIPRIVIVNWRDRRVDDLDNIKVIHN